MSQETATALWFLRIFEFLKKDYSYASEAYRSSSALRLALTEADPTFEGKLRKHYEKITSDMAKADSELLDSLSEVVRGLKDRLGSTKIDA